MAFESNLQRSAPARGEIVQRKQMERQLAVLGAAAYRVTAMRTVFDEGGDAQRVAKVLTAVGAGDDRRDLPIAADEVLARQADWRKWNARGWNVFIAPIDPNRWHLVVDDLTEETLSELRRRGYQPALVQRTSPKSIQAILVCRGDRGDDLDRAAANALVRRINQALGDKKFTGAEHPFRLSGFTNRKAAYERDGRWPFVTILEAAGVECDRTREMIERGKARLTKEVDLNQFGGACSPSPTSARSAHLSKAPVAGADAVEAYRELVASIRASIAARRGLDWDQSTADFQAAMRMLAGGFSIAQVQRAISTGRPDIALRHPDVMRYVVETATNAAVRVGQMQKDEARRLQQAVRGRREPQP